MPDEVPVIEDIVGALKGDDGKWKYLVRWRGYSHLDDTWEPMAHIGDKDPKRVKYFERKALKYRKAKYQPFDVSFFLLREHLKERGKGTGTAPMPNQLTKFVASLRSAKKEGKLDPWKVELLKKIKFKFKPTWGRPKKRNRGSDNGSAARTPSPKPPKKRLPPKNRLAVPTITTPKQGGHSSAQEGGGDTTNLLNSGACNNGASGARCNVVVVVVLERSAIGTE